MGFRNPRLPTAEDIEALEAQISSSMPTPEQELLAMISPKMAAAAPTRQPASAEGSVTQPQVARAPSEEQSLQAMLEQKFQAGIKRREQDLELQRMLAQTSANQPAEVDLSNFFEIAKAAGADKSAGAGYKAPVNANPMDYQKAITAAEGGLADDEVNYLKMQLAGKAASRQAGTQARWEAGKDMDAYKYTKAAFDKPIKDINDFNQASRGVQAALDSGDVFSVQNALSNFARMGGEKGVLTDQDIARVMPGSLDVNIAKVKSWLTGDPSVPMPAEMVEAIKGRIGDLERVAKQRLDDQVTQQSDMFSGAPAKFQQFSDNLAGVARKSLGDYKGGAASGGMNVDQSAVAAALERKRASKKVAENGN